MELWTELHTRALNFTGVDDSMYLFNFKRRIPRFTPGCKCKEFWVVWTRQNPPTFDRYFEWTVRIHNAVNKKLGKPTYTVEEARKFYEKDSSASVVSKVVQVPPLKLVNPVVAKTPVKPPVKTSRSATPRSVTPRALTPRKTTLRSLTPLSVTPRETTPHTLTPRSVTPRKTTPRSVPTKAIQNKTPRGLPPRDIKPRTIKSSKKRLVIPAKNKYFNK